MHGKVFCWIISFSSSIDLLFLKSPKVRTIVSSVFQRLLSENEVQNFTCINFYHKSIFRNQWKHWSIYYHSGKSLWRKSQCTFAKIVCSPNSFFVKSISRKISWKWISRNGSLCPYYYSIGTTWCKWMVSLRVKLCSLAFCWWPYHWRQFGRKRMSENWVIFGK